MELMTGIAPMVQMASSHLGSVEAISPTKPRSCSVFFLRARKTCPSPPVSPTAETPCCVSAATSDLLTRPPRTISSASRVSASVMRRPETNSDFLPIWERSLVSCTPPPWTSATWWPSRARSAMACAQDWRSSGFSRAAPPSLTTNFMDELQRRYARYEMRVRSQQALLLVEVGHEVHVLDGLGGSAFEQVVEARDDDESAMGFLSGRGAREMEAEVAEAGAGDVLNLRQVGRTANADERSVFVEGVKDRLEVVDGARFV